MEFRKSPNLRLVGPDEPEGLAAGAGKDRRRKAVRRVIAAALVVMIAAGAGILLSNHTYKKAARTALYEGETSGSGNYVQFADGFVRYSRDGIAFLDKRNKEQWIHPCQMRHPSVDLCGGTFAVYDVGGNSIIVCTADGVKGEMQTYLPIEKISVSGQGIVSAILKNESSNVIVLYDATGNILVEQQISAANLGYPVAIALSGDGETLGVSYFQAAGGTQKTKIVFYNYGKAGSGKADNIVAKDTYNREIFPEIHFIDENTAAAVGDKSFVIYEGREAPVKKKEIVLDREIKSVFYTDTYIGFILLNADKSGYEARLYNKSGRQAMASEFTGDFTDIKMANDEIIMTAGFRCLIIRKNGVQKFNGEMPAEPLEIIPSRIFNRYYVMGRDGLSAVYLTK